MTEQLVHIIDMALNHTSIVQVVLPPEYTKTYISKILKERGPWCIIDTVSIRTLHNMATKQPSMNLIINHYPKRELEIPSNFKRQIVILGHQPTVIKNRPCIVIQYNPPKEGTK